MRVALVTTSYPAFPGDPSGALLVQTGGPPPGARPRRHRLHDGRRVPTLPCDTAKRHRAPRACGRRLCVRLARCRGTHWRQPTPARLGHLVDAPHPGAARSHTWLRPRSGALGSPLRVPRRLRPLAPPRDRVAWRRRPAPSLASRRSPGITSWLTSGVRPPAGASSPARTTTTSRARCPSGTRHDSRESPSWRPGSIELPDVRERAARRRAERGSERLVVCAGRLVASKRIDRALDHVAREGRAGRRARVVVVGDGPERMKLESRARRLGVDALFVGRTTREDTLAWIGASDGLLHASRTEGLSTVVREAEALGVPVVVVDGRSDAP